MQRPARASAEVGVVSVVDFIVSGANLPFVVALGVGVLYVLVSWSGVASLLGGGDGHDADADAGDADGHDAHAEADGGDADGHDADGGDADGHDADADVGDADGHDADADDADADDADADDADGDDADGDEPGDGAARSGAVQHSQIHARAIAAPRASGALGGGKLPLSVRGPISLVLVGITGLAVNAFFFAETAAVPLVSLAWTGPLALGAAVLGGRVLGRALAPILDDRASQATSRKDLVGCFGTVISSAVRPDFGEVRFRDRSGHQLRLVVKLAPDALPLEEGDEAVVVDLDATGTPLVARLDLTPP